jgi:hypothetical protein
MVDLLLLPVALHQLSIYITTFSEASQALILSCFLLEASSCSSLTGAGSFTAHLTIHLPVASRKPFNAPGLDPVFDPLLDHLSRRIPPQSLRVHFRLWLNSFLRHTIECPRISSTHPHLEFPSSLLCNYKYPPVSRLLSSMLWFS